MSIETIRINETDIPVIDKAAREAIGVIQTGIDTLSTVPESIELLRSEITEILSKISSLGVSSYFDVLSNGQISAGVVQKSIFNSGGTVILQSTGSVDRTITSEDCGGKEFGYLLIVTSGNCSASGRYIHHEPSTTGDVILYINSDSTATSNNQALLLTKVSPGDTIKNNYKANVSTYSYWSSTTIFRLDGVSQTDMVTNE